MAEANASMSPVLLTFATARVPAAAICPTPCAAAMATALVAGVPLVVPWALADSRTHQSIPALVTESRGRSAASNASCPTPCAQAIATAVLKA